MCIHYIFTSWTTGRNRNASMLLVLKYGHDSCSSGKYWEHYAQPSYI